MAWMGDVNVSKTPMNEPSSQRAKTMQCCDPVIDGHIGGLLAEIERLRAAYLAHLQMENACKRTGQPCREPEKCGCDLELAEMLKLAPINQQATASADDHPLLQMGEDLRPTTMKAKPGETK